MGVKWIYEEGLRMYVTMCELDKDRMSEEGKGVCYGWHGTYFT